MIPVLPKIMLLAAPEAPEITLVLPVTVVAVTLVSPVILLAVPPRETDVLPRVTALLASWELGIALVPNCPVAEL